MRKTDIYTGGHPFTLDDLLNLDLIIQDVIDYYSKIVTDTSMVHCIMAGVKATLSGGPDNETDFTAGYIYWAGELYYFPGGTVDDGGGSTPHFAFQVVETNVAPSKVYRDGTTRNNYKTRTLQVVAIASAGDPGYLYWSTLKNLPLELYTVTRLGNYKRSWQVFGAGHSGLLSSFGHYVDTYGGDFAKVAYRKAQMGHIEFKGMLKIPSPISAGTTIGQVNSGFEPAKEKWFSVVRRVDTGSTIQLESMMLSISPDRYIRYQGTNNLYADSRISLDGISYQLDD